MEVVSVRHYVYITVKINWLILANISLYRSYVCSKIILMKTKNKHHIVFILNIHSMCSQSDR